MCSRTSYHPGQWRGGPFPARAEGPRWALKVGPCLLPVDHGDTREFPDGGTQPSLSPPICPCKPPSQPHGSQVWIHFTSRAVGKMKMTLPPPLSLSLSLSLSLHSNQRLPGTWDNKHSSPAGDSPCPVTTRYNPGTKETVLARRLQPPVWCFPLSNSRRHERQTTAVSLSARASLATRRREVFMSETTIGSATDTGCLIGVFNLESARIDFLFKGLVF